MIKLTTRGNLIFLFFQIILQMPRCSHLGCFGKALYEYYGQPGRWCGLHCDETAINVSGPIICIFCKEKATYGNWSNKKFRCDEHKDRHDRKLDPTSRCVLPECIGKATFSLSGRKSENVPLLCMRHRNIRFTLVDGDSMGGPSSISEEVAQGHPEGNNELFADVVQTDAGEDKPGMLSCAESGIFQSLLQAVEAAQMQEMQDIQPICGEWAVQQMREQMLEMFVDPQAI
jgi:hypothetical protein